MSNQQLSGSNKLVLDRDVYSISSSLIYMLSNYFTFDETVWMNKSLENLQKLLGICPLVYPPIMTVTAYLPCSLPSSHFKYKLSSPTFGVHISIYAWYPHIKESNENCFPFWIIKAISCSMFFNNSSKTCVIVVKAKILLREFQTS